MVAPLVGAWIEIGIGEKLSSLGSVAPLVGAWIEIPESQERLLKDYGRSPRGSVD